LFQRLFKDYGACTRARKLAMRRVWDACEVKAEEAFATNLKKAAEAAAARAKEDPATFAAVWKSSSALGYPEKYCATLREPPRHRGDAITETTSRRWRRASTPSNRRNSIDNIAMAWGT